MLTSLAIRQNSYTRHVVPRDINKLADKIWNFCLLLYSRWD